MVDFFSFNFCNKRGIKQTYQNNNLVKLAHQYELHKALVYIVYHFTVQVQNTGLEHGYHDFTSNFW